MMLSRAVDRCAARQDGLQDLEPHLMAKRDYYDILGISRTATADEIKKAHRKLARQYHPDMQSNKNSKQSEEKFKEVQEAYDVLSDVEKRQNYDQFGHAGVGAGAGAGRPGNGSPFDEAFRRAGAGGARGGRSGWRAGPNVTVEDLDPNDFSNSGDFSDIFDQLFGGRGGAAGRAGPRARAKPEPQRGADVEHPVTLTFEQAARGVTLPLQINRDGKLETIDIKIPPGVKDGSKIRIRGRGQQTGGEPGDLFIITQVLPHPYFRREGLDILLDLPLSLYEALLGAKVSVPTLDGPVTLTIPPGTSSHAKLRIKGRGVERGGEKGDELVVIKIIVPKDLDEEDRQVVKRLQEKHPIDARADVKW
jgi:DnaJ-class molecular chaperone